LELADGHSLTEASPLFVVGMTLQVDLDRVIKGPNDVVMITYDCEVATGILPIANLEFPEGTEIPEPSELKDDWTDNLPIEILDTLRKSRYKPTNPLLPFGMSEEDIIEVAKVFRRFKDEFSEIFNPPNRPVRVRLISAVSSTQLQERINEFLDSGIEIAHISERTIRLGGNEMVKEIRYYIDPPAEVLMVDLAVGIAENGEAISEEESGGE
jgi:hypothetical protein